jgi:hypothetical protein
MSIVIPDCDVTKKPVRAGRVQGSKRKVTKHLRTTLQHVTDGRSQHPAHLSQPIHRDIRER